MKTRASRSVHIRGAKPCILYQIYMYDKYHHMNQNSDQVNLLVFLDDADKITWLSYLDMEAIPGERNWFLWQISFVQLGNGFLHPFLYHRVHLNKNWKRSFCIFLTLELRNGSISIKSHIFVYKFPRGVTYINNQRKTVSA